ncbi:hypothetical protein JCM16303_001490 [Sporobolomyces ruberrimus]
MTVTDEWSTPSYQGPTPSTTRDSPTKRASRHSRISNEIEHFSFKRTSSTPSRDEETTEYRIGDAVLVDDSVKLKQKFLHPPLYQLSSTSSSSTNSKLKGNKKNKAVRDKVEEYTGWKHQDGLKSGDKVAVITRLYQDVRGTKMALVRWFARPGAVWGESGPQDDEVGNKTLPYELYYTADSSHLTEQREIEQRQLEKRSPSKSPSKLTSSSSFISSVASLKTPLHSDPVPVSSITRLVEILSPSPEEQQEEQQQEDSTSCTSFKERESIQSVCPTFIVRKIYDVKPVFGASFWSDLEVGTTEEGKKKGLGGWEDLRRRGIEGWKGVGKEEGGGGDRKARGWDVEPEMEVNSEEDEVLVRRKKAEMKKREKMDKKKREGKENQPAKKVVDDVGEESESDSEDDEREENFRPGRASENDNSSSDSGEEEDASSSEEDEDYNQSHHRSPSKRRIQASKSRSSGNTSVSPNKKRVQASTNPRFAKRRKLTKSHDPSSHSTSTSNPLPPLLSTSYLASLPSPLERAKALLHVSATPESLPCREDQRSRIRQFVEDAVLSRSGGCLYVHGVPGTGKTATVHSVVRELQNDPDMDSFTFVEINGMKISEPNAAFSHLWNALNASSSKSTAGTKPTKISPKAALAALEGWFANPDPARKTTVVLVDELDQMLTKRQEVLYNFFNWPHSAHSRLVVIAVANTMDLPERELNGKIRSRLGTNRIPFQPYTWTELKRILEARLALVIANGSPDTPVKLFEDTALQKIAKSVAGISGDARKALDVARRTLDRVALRTQEAGEEGVVKCTIQDATQAYNEMTKTGPAFFVKRLSLHEKVLLLALAQCVRRAGVPDVELESVLNWHDNFLRQTHLLSSTAYPSKSDLMTLISQLHSMRLVATESQRLDVFQKVRAGIEEGDVFAALREDELLKNHVPQA